MKKKPMSKEILLKTFRKPGELLLMTTFNNYKIDWLLENRM